MKYLFYIGIILFAKTTFAVSETVFTEYQFDAKECKIIQHNQSRIFVQPYTFYLDGKIYEGQVSLKYREFVDQLDIVINKIPMNYAANDKQHILESGGMFELMAYGNGKLLSFAPNKKIQVQLATKFNMAGGETFILNRQTKNWEKATPFGKLAESNGKPTDNIRDLWGDDVWQDGQWSDEIMDNNGTVMRASTGGYSQNFEEIRNQSFKTLNVDQMGMYNYDKILSEETIPILADFKLEGYNQKFNSQIYVAYKNRNAVLSYFPNQFLTDFKLLPNEEFTIFAIALDGKIAVLDNHFLTNFDAKVFKNKKVVFPMKVFAKKTDTKEELAQLTGL